MGKDKQYDRISSEKRNEVKTVLLKSLRAVTDNFIYLAKAMLLRSWLEQTWKY